jgi:hypothetical protein
MSRKKKSDRQITSDEWAEFAGSMLAGKKLRNSVFFEYYKEGDEFNEWKNVEIRACPNDDDYPIEITVDVDKKTTVGFALNKSDIRRFIAECYAMGVV